MTKYIFYSLIYKYNEIKKRFKTVQLRNNKTKMQKLNFTIEPKILEAISNSTKISNSEKIELLRIVGYMTNSEKKELVSLV